MLVLMIEIPLATNTQHPTPNVQLRKLSRAGVQLKRTAAFVPRLRDYGETRRSEIRRQRAASDFHF
jgi:hypothetical protein